MGFIYAHVRYLARRSLWNDLLSFQHYPFFIMGDFNAVLGSRERSILHPPNRTSCKDFADFISSALLSNLTSTGIFLTWSNRRFASGYMEARLDRALANDLFLDLWQNISLHVGTRTGSDHSPLFLNCDDTAFSANQSPFRYQSMWLTHPEFMTTVRKSWVLPLVAACPIRRVMLKLKRLKNTLKSWNKEVFGNIFIKLDKINAKISDLQLSATKTGYSEDLWLEEVIAQSEFCNILHQKSIFLKQKSRASWLSDGDRNSKFFHRAVKMKHSTDGIKSLEIAGSPCSDLSLIKAHVVAYYDNLFKSTMQPCPTLYQRISAFIPVCVSSQQNLALTGIPSSEEIKNTVFEMSPNSAPGPDGFSGQFFHSSWEIIGQDTIDAVTSFFIHGSFPDGLNASFVVLIPKSGHANKVEDYRPIVLGNFLYMIISKILATRLGPIVASFASANQFGFIHNRRIMIALLLRRRVSISFILEDRTIIWLLKLISKKHLIH